MPYVVGKRLPSRPLLSEHLHSCQAAQQQPRVPCHRQQEPGESTEPPRREAPEPVRQRLCRRLSRSSRSTAPCDGHGRFEVLCQTTLPGANPSVSTPRQTGLVCTRDPPAGTTVSEGLVAVGDTVHLWHRLLLCHWSLLNESC